MKILKNITVSTLVVVMLLVSLVDARETKKVSNFSGSNFVESSGTFDGNRIYADVTNNGLFLDYHVSGDSALEWPKGTGVHSIFQSALWMGATVNGQIRTIVGDYTQDMGPGPWGGDPLASVHRIYKVNKSMLDDPASHDDFQNWPVDFGAPWVDVDGGRHASRASEVTVFHSPSPSLSSLHATDAQGATGLLSRHLTKTSRLIDDVTACWWALLLFERDVSSTADGTSSST